MPRVSAKSTARIEASAERTRAKAAVRDKAKGWKTTDSFQNLIAQIGIQTDNVSSAGTYGFNPITRQRALLEWIHRGSWVAGLAVDIIPDDMTRNGVEVMGVDPDDAERIQELAQILDVWGRLRDAAAWGRLYGGALAVHMVDGQDYSTPLRIKTIGKDQYKGLFVLDRWMVVPAVNDLVQEPGPDLGKPKYYTVTVDAPGLRQQRIHHTRCIRMDGIRLPYWQKVTENMWSESVLERVYDRLLAFDSTTSGAAQLVYKSYLRTYAVKGMRELASAGGPALAGLASYITMMARFQSIEGVTLIDSEDKFEAHQHSAFSGLAEILIHFGQQISGAIQIPLVRLFGQSPAGLNSTGDSDLRTYYENVANQQNRDLKVGVTQTFRMIAQSLGVKVDEGYSIKFKPLWLLTETDRANIAQTLTTTIAAGADMGVSPQVMLKELRESSDITGVWGNISDEDIEAAETEPPPSAAELMQQQTGAEGGPEAGKEPGEEGNKPGTGEPAIPKKDKTGEPEERPSEKTGEPSQGRKAVK